MDTKGSFPEGKAAEVVKLTNHLHLVPRSRMRGAVSPLPNMPPWRGAQLKKHGDSFTFILRLRHEDVYCA